MTASLEKARLKKVRVVQPTPLESPPSFDPPVEDLGTAAPSTSAYPDGAASQVEFDHGDHYGGHQATRFNSSAVDDQEMDLRNEYLYHQGRNVRSATSSAPGLPGPFLSPLIPSRRIWPRPSCVNSNNNEKASITGAGQDGKDPAGHRTCLDCLFPRHSDVCRSG
jgi:hypothetical protein